VYDEKIANSETDILLLPGRGGWFTKKGEGLGRDQTRYFTPAWGPRSKALKFVYFASIKDGEPHDRKGFVPVLPDSGVAAQDDMLCVVRPLVPAALFP
jgi:hypothetical protein